MVVKPFCVTFGSETGSYGNMQSGNPAEGREWPTRLHEDQPLDHAEEHNIAILDRIQDFCRICGSISDTGDRQLPSQIRFWNT
jgi:hypothetical protein